jgi:hypothetical protein
VLHHAINAEDPAIIASTFLVVCHLFTLRVPHELPKIPFFQGYGSMRKMWGKVEAKYRGVGFQYRFTSILCNVWTYSFVTLLLLAGSIPSIACVEAAMSKYRGTKGIGYFPARGLGFQL